VKTVPLTQGLSASVDDRDFEKVSGVKWYAARYGRLVYAQREFRLGDGITRCVKMHQLILPPVHGKIIDHKDGNGLNCCRYNLRYATDLNNGSNKRKRLQKSTSVFKGVHWRKDNQKWRASIRVNWKLISLGQFDSEESAARAYDTAAKKHFGEFASLNFK